MARLKPGSCSGSNYAFGISLPGSMKGFFTTVAVRGPSGADFVWVVLDRHVGAVVQDACLDAADIRGTRGAEVVLLTRLDDGVPETPALRTVEQIELVSDLARPTGAGDEERDPVEFRP